MSDIYKNPYKSDTKEYSFYRYAFLKRSQTHEKAIEYSDCKNNDLKKKILGIPAKPRIHEKAYYEPRIPTYPLPDPENIISTDINYIYYPDKIWSKSRDTYLKVHDNKWVFILDPNADNTGRTTKKCMRYLLTGPKIL